MKVWIIHRKKVWHLVTKWEAIPQGMYRQKYFTTVGDQLFPDELECVACSVSVELVITDSLVTEFHLSACYSWQWLSFLECSVVYEIYNLMHHFELYHFPIECYHLFLKELLMLLLSLERYSLRQDPAFWACLACETTCWQLSYHLRVSWSLRMPQGSGAQETIERYKLLAMLPLNCGGVASKCSVS